MPFNFTFEGYKFTLRLKLDKEGEETEDIELAVEGQSYFKHPFVSEDFILDDDRVKIY